MIKKLFIILILLIAFPYLSSSIPTMKEIVNVLASDDMEGRKAGSVGIEKAAKFIEELYTEIGIKPIDDSYRQSFDFISETNFSSESSVAFNVIIPKPGVPLDKIKPRVKTWEPRTDWQIFSYGGSGKLESEVVFVGYGISSPENKYDDYEGIDVNGKAVIILTETPKGNEDKFSKFNSYYYKTQNAVSKGAKAILFVKVQGDSANVFETVEYIDFGPKSDIIVLQVNRTKIAEFFPKSQQLFPVEKEINLTLKPNSFALPNVTISMNINIEHKKAKTDNLIGIIKGNSDKYIVLAAHYDHLGYESAISKSKTKGIHNGADDNASGVAMMLELANKLKDSGLVHNLLIIAFSAEEKGLIGSKYFVENPLVPLDKISCVVNFDMVGKLKDKKLNMYYTLNSPFDNSVNNIPDTKFKVEHTNFVKDMSDHAPFENKGIAVCHFFTGIHNDYHTTRDDPETLNYSGMDEISIYAESLIKLLDTSNFKK